MNGPSIAALAIGRSAIRRRILSLLLADRAGDHHLRDIQRLAMTTPGTASRELSNLVAAGLIERERVGQQVFFRAAETPFVEMLRSLLAAEQAAAEAPDSPASPEPARAPDPADAAELAEVAGASDRPEPATSTPGWQRSGPAPEILAAAGRFEDALRAEFQDRLADVVLYGSRARGDARPDSDINFLVVMKWLDGYYDEIERSSQATNALSLELGAVVSRVFVTARQWDESMEPFFVRVRREGIPV